MSYARHRPRDLRAVYESSYPVNPNTGERFRTYEEWLQGGKSFLDYSNAEARIVADYLASRTIAGRARRTSGTG